MSFSSWCRRLGTALTARPRAAARQRRWRKRSAVLAAAGVAIAAIVGVVVTVGPGRAMLRTTAQRSGTGPASTGRRGAGAAARSRATGPAAPLRVVSVSPSGGASAADGAKPVRVVFSAPLAGSSPMPRLSPAVPGAWRRSADAAVFTPRTGFLAGTKVTVTVPGGASGVRSAAGARSGRGGRLASPVTRSFTTGSFSTLRLQQLLAQLGYLPLSWAPAGTPVARSSNHAELAAAYSPPAGTFSWKGGYPSILRTFWRQGAGNLIEAGAIRAFESENGLTMDGAAGPQVWQALLRDIAAGRRNTNGYTYAVASKASPETLTIWHDGHQVLHSPANTGIAAAPTADGTFPVYERLPFQVMKGTNPNGTQYADPVRNVSYFNGGDAVHYIARSSYGWPQSLGCVELPLPESAVAYRYLTYGSLVTVRA